MLLDSIPLDPRIVNEPVFEPEPARFEPKTARFEPEPIRFEPLPFVEAAKPTPQPAFSSSSSGSGRSQNALPRRFDVVKPEKVQKIQGRIPVVDRYTIRNDDGSITWGYQSADGSFKEETIGVDCVTRGR